MKKYISDRLRDSGMIRRISESSMQIKISCLAILFMFLFCTGFAPLHKINELKKLTGADTLFLESYDSTYDHPEIQPLVREKAYKSALLTLSGQDSIQLIINLHDSVACLSIRGVIIHEIRMKYIRIDPFLKKLHNI